MARVKQFCCRVGNSSSPTFCQVRGWLLRVSLAQLGCNLLQPWLFLQGTRSLPAFIVRKCFLLFAWSYSLFDFVLFFSFRDKCHFTARKQTGYLRDYSQDSTQTLSRTSAVCLLWSVGSKCLISLLGIQGTAFQHSKGRTEKGKNLTSSIFCLQSLLFILWHTVSCPLPAHGRTEEICWNHRTQYLAPLHETPCLCFHLVLPGSCQPSLIHPIQLRRQRVSSSGWHWQHSQAAYDRSWCGSQCGMADVPQTYSLCPFSSELGPRTDINSLEQQRQQQSVCGQSPNNQLSHLFNQHEEGWGAGMF